MSQAQSAQHAVRSVVEGGRMAAHETTENDLINAVLRCAEFEKIQVPKSRISPALRTHPTTPDHAARALGIAVRKIDLASEKKWWIAQSEALLVNFRGEWLAITPRGVRSVLHLSNGATVNVTAEVAQEIQPDAWGLIPSLQDGPTGVKQLIRLGWSHGSVRDVLFLVATAVVSIFIGMIVPVTSGLIIGELVPAGEAQSIVVLMVILILIAVMTTFIAASQGLIIQRLSARFGIRITEAIYERVFRLPASFHRENVPGELGERIAGAGIFRSAMASIVPSIISAVGALIGSVIVLSYLSPSLVVGVVGLALLSVLIGVAMLPKLGHNASRQTESNIELTGLTFSMLVGIAKIRTAGAEERMFSRWTYRFAKMHMALRDVSQTNLIMGLVSSLPTALVPIILVVSEATGASQLTIGEFTTATSASASAAAAIVGLLPLAIGLVSAWPSIVSLKPVLEAEPEPLGNAGGDPGVLSGRVSFDTVNFGYTPEMNILSDVTFNIPAGTMTAIVGASGSGKSTIIRLLLGLETPESGTVLYDGQALSSLDRAAVLAQMGIVPQESALIPGSILENILASAPGSTEEDAWRAAERAGIAQDIREMPMGMQTVISDGASTFSGGQKQRLMIARALVNEPRILILDEATSALDNHTQTMVSESIENLGSTRIVVAHRLSTIRGADQIIVLDKGKVIEVGTYDELMALNGAFTKLASRQIA
ncbi:ATP-binding cassette domain-containing protein [Aurantimicrobium minutum]|uniref:ATP-binding cassette domain-containing protein n=1 Tax=Aurantimicrobium minutum TaxID=708131 RepID=UPI0024765570|nr:ATP-binding cassette domain-containing protein [Aurantimicrobium minutum]MDH6423400.1 ABC-type bacteriocin/lantibiotic exporter with double-glycine peptidase domain [Aurantimicrobium minutum]